MAQERTLTANEACLHLGIHKQTLEKYQQEGKLLPDVKFPNGERMYYMSTLEAFRKRYRSQLMTLDHVAEFFGVSTDMVAYCFRKKRHIQPDAKSGKWNVFSDAKVIMVAKSEGWIEDLTEVLVGKMRVGIMFLVADPPYVVYRREEGRIYPVHQGFEEEAAQDAFESEVTRLQVQLVTRSLKDRQRE